MNSLVIIKIIHVFSVFAWMAGMFYLPRLYVYHASANLKNKGGAKGEVAQTLALMERRLLRIIINPAMIVAILTGLHLMFAGGFARDGWLHGKLGLVIILTAVHGLLSYHRKQLLRGTNKRSVKYFRVLNEVPTVLLLLILILVIAKPF